MSTDTPAPPARSLGRLLNLAAGAANNRANEMLAPYGLTLGHWVLLSALWRKDGLLVGDLGEYSGNNLPAASRMVARMEEAGLVVREPDISDRRAVRVQLTEKGKSLRHLKEFYKRVNTVLLEDFNVDEVARLFALLERLTINARKSK